nr:hypothetical protein [Haematobacter massiliensis]
MRWHIPCAPFHFAVRLVTAQTDIVEKPVVQGAEMQPLTAEGLRVKNAIRK